MLLTPDFTYLHFPKTGGSFVSHHLRRAYPGGKGKLSRLMTLLTGRVSGVINTADYPSWRIPHHAPVKKIPYMLKGKMVVSNIRNPFDRYVSRYYYGGWKVNSKHISNLWPNGVPSDWPDLSFEDFVESLTDMSLDQGAQSRELKSFFGDLLPRVRFLRFESLANDLYQLLLSFEIDNVEILRNERKLPPKRKETVRIRKAGESWEMYYSRRLVERVLASEKYFFESFPEYVPKDLEH